MKNPMTLLALLPLTLLAALPACAAPLAPASAPSPPASVVSATVPSVSGAVRNFADEVRTAGVEKDGRITLVDFEIAQAVVRADINGKTGAPGIPALYLRTFLFMPRARAAPPSTKVSAESPRGNIVLPQVEVVIAPSVVQELKALGIDDPAAHFRGRRITFRGVFSGVRQPDADGANNFPVYTVTVDRIGDIHVIAPVPVSPAASRCRIVAGRTVTVGQQAQKPSETILRQLRRGDQRKKPDRCAFHP